MVFHGTLRDNRRDRGKLRDQKLREHAGDVQESRARTTPNWLVNTLHDYKSQHTEYTYETAHCFLMKQHYSGKRMFAFHTLWKHSRILASYANEGVREDVYM